MFASMTESADFSNMTNESSSDRHQSQSSSDDLLSTPASQSKSGSLERILEQSRCALGSPTRSGLQGGGFDSEHSFPPPPPPLTEENSGAQVFTRSTASSGGIVDVQLLNHLRLSLKKKKVPVPSKSKDNQDEVFDSGHSSPGVGSVNPPRAPIGGCQTMPRSAIPGQSARDEKFHTLNNKQSAGAELTLVQGRFEQEGRMSESCSNLPSTVLQMPTPEVRRKVEEWQERSLMELTREAGSEEKIESKKILKPLPPTPVPSTPVPSHESFEFNPKSYIISGGQAGPAPTLSPRQSLETPADQMKSPTSASKSKWSWSKGRSTPTHEPTSSGLSSKVKPPSQEPPSVPKESIDRGVLKELTSKLGQGDSLSSGLKRVAEAETKNKSKTVVEPQVAPRLKVNESLHSTQSPTKSEKPGKKDQKRSKDDLKKPEISIPRPSKDLLPEPPPKTDTLRLKPVLPGSKPIFPGQAPLISPQQLPALSSLLHVTTAERTEPLAENIPASKETVVKMTKSLSQSLNTMNASVSPESKQASSFLQLSDQVQSFHRVCCSFVESLPPHGKFQFREMIATLESVAEGLKTASGGNTKDCDKLLVNLQSLLKSIDGALKR